MQLPRVRFTVRRMMVAVAVVTAVLWVVERRERFRRIAPGTNLSGARSLMAIWKSI